MTEGQLSTQAGHQFCGLPLLVGGAKLAAKGQFSILGRFTRGLDSLPCRGETHLSGSRAPRLSPWTHVPRSTRTCKRCPALSRTSRSPPQLRPPRDPAPDLRVVMAVVGELRPGRYLEPHDHQFVGVQQHPLLQAYSLPAILTDVSGFLYTAYLYHAETSRPMLASSPCKNRPQALMVSDHATLFNARRIARLGLRSFSPLASSHGPPPLLGRSTPPTIKKGPPNGSRLRDNPLL